MPGLLLGLLPLTAPDAAARQDDPDPEPVPDYLRDAADDPYAQDLGMAPDPTPTRADDTAAAPDGDAAALPTQSLAVPTLSSPGMPRVLRTQTSRFTSLFNPAIGFSLDGLLDYQDVSGGESGLDLTLRTAEMTAQAWIDPAWWGYLAIAADEEELELEEAAAHYVGFSQNTTVRVGKMFVDFGKQMQVHIHDLLTPERPAVLTAYLGEELAGTGVQLDHWWPVGESTAVRVSGAVFADLTQTHGHGEDEVEEGAEPFAPERKDLDQLAYTARLTGMTDVGTNGQVQLGLSWRGLPGFGFAAEDDTGGVVTAEDLSNQVYGTDLTFGWASDDGTRSWTTGLEYLVIDGDLAAELDAPMTGLDITSGSRSGWYGYVDHEFDRFTSAGVMVSEFEHLEAEAPSDLESTVYFTRYMSEFSRLRLALTHVDSGEGPDAWRAMVQFTAFLGPHGHPYNW